jgi:hypothetical protein
MKYLKHSIAGAAVALAGLTAFGQTEISVAATDNGTIQTEGVSGSPWFHNAQVAGNFESYGVSTFVIDAADFGFDTLTGIESIEISYTQANAGFTTDGPVELFLTLDSAVAGADYSALNHDSSASGIDDAQFSDSPSAQSIGTGTFTEVADGTVDTYTLDVSGMEAELLAAINSGAGFGIILSANGSEGAVTYAGIQSRDYPNSIILNVSATGESGGGGEPADGPALIISGVLDGPLPGGLPKAIEFYALEDIADLSLYGFGSANNGGGSDGEEVVMAGSASAGDFLYLATEEEAFTSVFGFAPDFVDGAAAINGDDALELFYEGQVIDTFGDINVDGNGEPWEYLDSWAYRVDETMANPAFAIGDWTFGGADALDGLDEAGVAAAFPFGTYMPGEAPVSGLPWDGDDLQVDDVVRSPWLGSFTIGGDDWINHVEQKWLYVGLVESAESMFIYSLFLDGWVWSSMDTYPLMYDFDNSRWVYYLVIDEVTSLLYDYSIGEWTEG